MNKNIKMVAFDLDGTLLDSEKRISEYTRMVLEKAIEQGIVVIPATGRPIIGLPEAVRNFPGIKYAVTSNGARIVDVQTDETVSESSLAVETAVKVLEVFEEYDCHREIIIDTSYYANEDTLERIHDYHRQRSLGDYTQRTRIPVEDVKKKALDTGKPLEKVHAVFKYDEELNAAKKRLDQIEGIVAANAVGNNWEVNKIGTDKGNALLDLGKILGIAREEIMAFGDGMNDYEMVKKVGVGVVMENGEEELKKIADYICETNDEHGVAKTIEQFVLK